ncbi:MAG: hypothetical protein ACKVOK_02960 [Flavobacteriales bacterium]
MISELRSVIKAYYEIERAWHSENKKTDEYLAAVCFFEHMTYRLTEADKSDQLIGLRMSRRLMKRLFSKSKEAILVVHPEQPTIVLGGIIRTRDIIVNYVDRCADQPVGTYIAKDFITGVDLPRWSLLFCMIPFMVRQSWRAVISKRRINFALSIHEVFEIAYLKYYIRTKGIKHIYDWIPYEKDSNFLSLQMMKEGAEVTKIPSPGPLATHNRIMIGTEIIFSTPYHFEELKRFGDTIRAQKFSKWPPQGAEANIQQYMDHPQPPRFTLGFYSHGSWVRKAEKHAQHGRAVDVAEAKILGLLGRFIQENPEFKLTIFPHPRERKHSMEMITRFYTTTIGHNQFSIVDKSHGTVASFHLVDIAIGAFSSILYERMYCGYKTLIGNIGFHDFPMNGSTLNTISFVAYEEMQELIKRFAPQSDDWFFEQTKLDEYRYTKFQKMAG